ncbi:hypothetical protein H0H81_002717, partial [Sphagnurus paluster]
WLSDEQIDQILHLLEMQLRESFPSHEIYILDSIFTRKLIQAFNAEKSGEALYDPNANSFIERLGSKLTLNSELRGIFHVKGNHWVTAAVDIMQEALAYGDPAGGPVDEDVVNALWWFISKHLPSFPIDHLDFESMPCLTQDLYDDWWSCGVFSFSALSHFFMLGKDSMGSPFDCALPLTRFTDSSIDVSTLATSFDPAAPIFGSANALPPMRNTSNSPSKVHVSAAPGKHKTIIVSGKKRKVKDAVSVIAPIFEVKPLKTVEQLVARTKARKMAPTQDVSSAASDLPSDALSDNEQAHSGRPHMNILEALTVEVKTKPGAPCKYHCAGIGCMDSKQRQFTSTASASFAPGALAAATSQEPEPSDDTIPPSLTQIPILTGQAIAIRASNTPHADEFFGLHDRKETHHSLDFVILKFICAAQLAPFIVDLPEWKDIFKITCPSYTPASRTHLMDDHIMSEQEHVCKLVLEFLQTKHGLTLSFDGGSTRGREAFYTAHVTTPDHFVFLVEGRECTRESHTGKWIANFVLSVMRTIGIELFIAVSSDSTGNTHLSRAIIETTQPSILNLPNAMHHLNNTLKQISSLPYFKQLIKRVRTVIKYFKHSKPVKAMLKDIRISQGLGPGLESIGKTRFSTLTWSAESVRRCLPAIRDLVTLEKIQLPKYNEAFINNLPTTLQFEIQLNQFLALGMGISQAIECLEASSTNAADVYLYWLAVVAKMNRALSTCCLPDDVCAQVRSIMVSRWRAFFVTGPTNVHLCAFYLNPCYVQSPIFKNPNPLTFNITLPAKVLPKVPPGIKSPKTFLEVGNYLLTIAVNEINYRTNLLLVSYKDKPAAFIKAYQAQFTAYAQHSYPFNVPFGQDQDSLDWWLPLETTPNAEILATIAVKIYSAVPHSMADERTMSAVTMMNTAQRSRQKVETIMAMVQIQEYYKNQKQTKICKSAWRRPILKFYDVERVLQPIDEDEMQGFGSHMKAEESDEEFENDEAGMEAVAALVPSPTLSLEDDDEINILALEIEEILADAPIAQPEPLANPKVTVSALPVEEKGGKFELAKWI